MAIPPDRTSADQTRFMAVETLGMPSSRPRRTTRRIKVSSALYLTPRAMASREASAGLAANSEVSCYSVVIARFLIVQLQSIAHARAVRQANHMSMTVSDHKQELRHYRLTTAERSGALSTSTT